MYDTAAGSRLVAINHQSPLYLIPLNIPASILSTPLIITIIIINTTMSEQGQEEDASDPNVYFNERKLFNLILNKKWDEVTALLDRLTLENKRFAVNYKEGGFNKTH